MTTTNPLNKPRRPAIAGIANLLAPPLGHFYVGRPGRGILAYLLNLSVGATLLLFLLTASSVYAMTGLLLLLVTSYLAVAADAFLLARRSAADYELRRVNRWYAYLGAVVVIGFLSDAVTTAVRRDLVQAYRIPSGAMIPTLLLGDHILVDKQAYRSGEPHRGDVVVFEYPEDPSKTFVKRIVGLPGDVLEIREKTVWINGAALEEPYAVFAQDGREPANRLLRAFGPSTVPADSYFMMGDNRDRSHDSRFWGPVARDKIWGRVRTIYWSWFEGAVRWSRIGTRLD